MGPCSRISDPGVSLHFPASVSEAHGCCRDYWAAAWSRMLLALIELRSLPNCSSCPWCSLSRVSHFKHRGSGPPSPPKSLGDGHGTNGPLSPCLHQAMPSSLNHSLVIGCDHELRHSRHLFHHSGRLRKANAGPREWIYQSLSYRWCVPSPDRHRIHCSLTAGTKDLLSQPPSSRSLRR